MSKKHIRQLSLAALTAAALALGACATPFRADVSRFQAELPAPRGQSFHIESKNPALTGGIEFGHYASLVAGELTRYGYRPAAPGERADLIVNLDYGIDQGREQIRSTGAGFNDPWYGGFGWGRGYYRPVVVVGPNGRRFLYGYRDPFLWGGFGSGFGYDDVTSYTVYTSGLDLHINRASTGERLFEGHAEAKSRDNSLPQIVPNLIQAMFTGFPGNSGEEVRITLAPPPKG